VSRAIADADLAVCSVLSGNRNFEGRIHPETKLNYLASSPLVVAYALTGSMGVNLTHDPLGVDPDGQPVYLRDIWPSTHEIERVIGSCVRPEMFQRDYADVFAGDQRWQSLPTPGGETFTWDPASTYVRRPPYFKDMPAEPGPPHDIKDARVLAVLGDSVTTDHISPAGAIRLDSPAGAYLREHGIEPRAVSALISPPTVITRASPPCSATCRSKMVEHNGPALPRGLATSAITSSFPCRSGAATTPKFLPRSGTGYRTSETVTTR
jgi:aconitate hydratase